MDDVSVKNFVNRIAAHFQSGEFEDLLHLVANPLIVYSETVFRATLAREEIVKMARHFRDVMKDLGATSASAKVDEIKRHSANRIRVRAIITYSDSTGAILARTVVRYYCTGATSDDLTVEIVEYVDPGLPGTVCYFQNPPALH